jgi:putative transposase
MAQGKEKPMARKRKDIAKEAVDLLKTLLHSERPTASMDVSPITSILNTNPLLGKVLSALLSKERDYYLQQEPQDPANGFYERTIESVLGNVDMEVPRTRSGNFRPQLLPEPWVRRDISFDQFLKELLLAGFSRQKIKRVLKVRGQSFPEDLIDEMCDSVEQEFRLITSKHIPEEILALLIDCKQVECLKKNGTVGNVTLYQIYGIDWNANRDIYYFEVSEEKENAKKWLSIFSRLVERGLRRVLVIITDNLSGITEAVKSIFPESLHQLCVVHLKRNIHRHLSREDARAFCEQFDIIKVADDSAEAQSSFIRLCEQFEGKHPHLMKSLKQDAAHYTAFTRFPKEIRQYLYCTNLLEGINNCVEIVRRSCGGYFRSESHLTTSYAVAYERLKSGKWANPHSRISGYLRELRIVFQAIFQVLE